jgi:hypothetical protein
MQLKQAGRITKQREEAIDRVLTYVSLSESEPIHFGPLEDGASSALDKLDPLHFNQMQIWTLYESLSGTTTYERLVFNPKKEPDLFDPSLCPAWDFCFAFFNPQTEATYKSAYLFSLNRIRRVPLPAIRGMFKLRTGQVFEVSLGVVLNSGKIHTGRMYVEHIGKGDLDVIEDPRIANPRVRVDREDELWETCWLAKSCALTAEYDWCVDLGYRRHNAPMVSIVTDPISARGIFKLRDIPPGASRREAIKHWVNGHQRKTKNGCEYKVTAHLKGAETFNWNGLECIIRPSEHDLKLAARLRQQADAMQRRAACDGRKWNEVPA